MAEIEGTVTLDSVAAEVPVIALAKVGGEYQILDSTISAPDGTYGLNPGGAAFIVALGGNGAAHGAVAAGALWTPAEIAPAIWYDTSDSATVTLVGSVASAISNKGTLSYNLTQGTSSARPLLDAASLNGLDTLRLDGDNDRLENSNGVNLLRNSSGGMTFVVKKTNTVTTGQEIFGVRQQGARRVLLAEYTGVTGVVNIVRSLRTDNGSATTETRLDTTSTVDTDWHFLSAVTNFGEAKLTLVLDGTVEAHTDSFGTAGNTSNTDAARIRMGCGTANTASGFFNGNIAEVIIIETDVSLVTRQLIEGYLAWKWGLQANLPSGHPYKDAAPTV